MVSVLRRIMGAAAVAIDEAARSCGYELESAEQTISVSKQFGDISSSAAMKIAKRVGANAGDVAGKLAGAMKPIGMVKKITVENGFLNMHLDRKAFSSAVLEMRQEGVALAQGRMLIEYMSVNPNKPWHVGHLRNALIGDALANIYEAAGYEVERQDYVDDLGLQMAELLWWLDKNGIDRPQDKKYDLWLGEEYVNANGYIDAHKEDAKAEIDEMMGLMSQDGTAESMKLRRVAGECVAAQYQTAFDYKIYHNLMVWESDIVRERLLEKSLELMLSKGIARKEQSGEYAGCTVIGIEGLDAAGEMKGVKEQVKVLVRSNGAATYLAKDIAYHMWKIGLLENSFKYNIFIDKQPNGKPIYTTSHEGKRMDFGNVDNVVNVIDVRQSQPQSVLRMVFKAMGGKASSAKILHIAYGEVQLESGSISGRRGTWMNGYTADEVLSEAVRRAEALVTSRFEMGALEKAEVARSVALAAIKFDFLKTGLEKTIAFSWSRTINFDGDTGPYHQYMHARANRIVLEAGAKAAENVPEDVDDTEFSLVKTLAQTEEMIAKASNESRPNVITDHLCALSSEFSRFYERCPVLKAPEERRAFRISLTRAFRDTSAKMLGLLGIDAPERM